MSGSKPDDSPLELATRGAVIEHRVSDSFALPMQLEVWLQMTQCSSVLGPQLQVHASLLLSDLRARVAFAAPANGNGEPGRVTAIESGLLHAGERLIRPQRPARLRVARPAVQFSVADHAGHPLGDGAVSVRCVDGARGFLLPFPADVGCVLWFTARGSGGEDDPRVVVSGDLHFPRGVALRIGDAPGIGDAPTPDAGDAEQRPAQAIELIPPGRSVPLHHEELRASAFRTAEVSVCFVDAANRAYGTLHRIGSPAGEVHAEGATP